MDVSRLRNERVSVIGAARSGVAVARLLQTSGARVFVSDRDPEEKLVPQGGKSPPPLLAQAGIPYELGGHTDRVYDCSLMVISPGVPSNAPVVREAQTRALKVVS